MTSQSTVAVSLRPAVDGDLAFARDLYFETMRWIVERLFGWDETLQIERFASQFDVKNVRIVVHDGTDIGWLLVAETADCVFLGQIYIAPAYQRRGIGTALVRDVIRRADELGLPARLGVVKFNPALSLYERLGFETASEDEYKYYMERRTSPV